MFKFTDVIASHVFTESYPDILLIRNFCVYTLSIVDLTVF